MHNKVYGSHLYYILENKIKNDKYSGLSHVAEHALLIPTDIGLTFSAKGYTCSSHVCLYFSTSKLAVLREVDDFIMNGQVLTDENVSIAKEQVKQEIVSLREKMNISNQIVSFVTDGRITCHAIGELDQVEKIQTADVVSWFEQRILSAQVHRYLFNDTNEIISSTQYIPSSTPIPSIKNSKKADNAINILNLVSSDKIQTIRAYFKIPVLTNKLDILKKGLVEYCVQRKISRIFGIDIDINDKFFDTDERYVLMEFMWNRSKEPDETIRAILFEMRCISYEDYILYRDEFVRLLNELHLHNESAYQIIKIYFGLFSVLGG